MSLASELLALEKRLLDPHTRSSPEEISAILSDDFLEFGSSGKIYDKVKAVEVLAALDSGPYELTDFAVRELAPAVVLATYTVRFAGKHSLRSSIWKLRGDSWRLTFHQGTPIPS